MARDKRYLTCYPGPSTEESNPDSSERNISRVEMGKSDATLNEVISRLPVKELPNRSITFTPDGYWVNIKYHFVKGNY